MNNNLTNLKICKNLKWIYGEKPQRSNKEDVYLINNTNTNTNTNYNIEQFIKNENEDNIISFSQSQSQTKTIPMRENQRNIFEYRNDINVFNLNNNKSSYSLNQYGEFNTCNNKREMVNNKLNERYSIRNIGQNPYNQNDSYVKDIENQEKFMIPKSSYLSETNK